MAKANGREAGVSVALAIPDPSREAIPRGWSEQVLAAVEPIEDIGTLDTGCAELQGYIAAFKKKGHDVTELQCAKLHVEGRIGELLGPPAHGGDRRSDQVGAPRLESLSKDQRSELRRLAWYRNGRGWEPAREIRIEAVRNGKRSRGAVLRYIDERVRPTPADEPQEQPALDIRRGDFREVLADLETASVALILTDPPYPAEYLPLWSDMAELAARVLMPGGSLLAYSGQGNLPDVLTRLSEHLRYWWTLSLSHGHGSQNLPGKFVTIGWKPIVWFVKDRRRDHRYVADRLAGTSARKTLHEWAQGRDELVPLIESFTAPDELIVDPFAGSGTVGEAAVALNRRFVGAEVGGG